MGTGIIRQFSRRCSNSVRNIDGSLKGRVSGIISVVTVITVFIGKRAAFVKNISVNVILSFGNNEAMLAPIIIVLGTVVRIVKVIF